MWVSRVCCVHRCALNVVFGLALHASRAIVECSVASPSTLVKIASVFGAGEVGVICVGYRVVVAAVAGDLEPAFDHVNTSGVVLVKGATMEKALHFH